MVSHFCFYPLRLLVLVWLFLMLHYAWPSARSLERQQPPTRGQPRRQRSTEPEPFAGLIQKPPCALCEHAATHPKLPARCHPPRASCPSAAPVRSTPRGPAGPRPAGRIAGDWGEASAAPTAIPAGGPGVSCTAPAVMETFWRPTAPGSMANVSRWTFACLSSRAWRRAWVSGAPRGCAASWTH